MLAAALPLQAVAQSDNSQLHRDVDVVSTYMPTLSNPFKLQVSPVLDDTMSYKPTFTYNVLNRVQTVTTTPDSLAAATMSFKGQDNPYKALVKLAGGNYTALNGELYYNIGNSADYHLSVALGHLSMLGKVKLCDDSKVKAPMSNTWASTTFRRMFSSNVLGCDLNFYNNAYEYYGYSTIVDTAMYNVGSANTIMGKDIKGDKKQRVTNFDMAVSLANYMDDRHDDVTYMGRLGFGLFSNRTGVKQFDITADANLRVPVSEACFVGGDVDVDFFKVSVPDSYDERLFHYAERNHGNISLAPHFGVDNDHFKVRLGLKFIFEIADEADNIYFNPDIWADYNIADGIVALYAGITGSYKANSFRDIVSENKFVSPDASTYLWKSNDKAYIEQNHMTSTVEPIRLAFGLRAAMSKMVSLNVGIDYGSFEDELFYVNSGYSEAVTGEYHFANRFGVVAENGKLFKAHGELTVKPTSKSQFALNANYYNWDLNYLEKPWFRPAYEVGVSAKFFPIERLLIEADANISGDRYAFNHATRKAEALDMIADINVAANYYITSRWTAFVKLNNVAASNNEKWYGYASHRFNAMLGATFKF